MLTTTKYREMFALSEADLKKRIVECARDSGGSHPEKPEGITLVSAADLPNLPFKDNQFDLALCAYFLFSRKELSAVFHLAAIKEMCRVAGEARIYPLVDEEGEPSEILPQIMLQLQQENYGLELKEVADEFQKGGNAMLRVWSQACSVT